MARPSDRLNQTLRFIGLKLAPVALAAKGAGEVEGAALSYLVQALEACRDWRADTTEASRRRAARLAAAAEALAIHAPGAQGVRRVRFALAGYASAVIRFTEADANGALRAAEGAAEMTQEPRDKAWIAAA